MYFLISFWLLGQSNLLQSMTNCELLHYFKYASIASKNEKKKKKNGIKNCEQK